MFNVILFLLFTAAVVAISVHTIIYYRDATGTRWERILATSRHSATWVWAKVMLVSGLLIEGVAQAAEFLNLPDVSAFIHQKVPASYLGVVLVIIAAMTFAARFRGLVGIK